MNRFVSGVAAVVVGLAATATASAQFPHQRNIIRNSGNGQGNTIIARNHFPAAPINPYGSPGLVQPGYAQPGFAQPGFAPSPAMASPGLVSPYYGSPSPGYGPVGGFGGISRNVINTSGNGIGNTIIANNGGFNPFGPAPWNNYQGFGVNLNVVTNSANGQGNFIQTGNGGRPGVNINVITNSGNGIGNVIRAFNR